MLAGFLFGNENIAIETRMRNENSSDVARVHSINSVAKERMPNGFLESNMV